MKEKLAYKNKKKTLKNGSFCGEVLIVTQMWAFDPIVHDIDIDLKFIYLLSLFPIPPHLFFKKYLNKVTSLFSIGLF